MEFTVLGSGTSVPHPERTSSRYWVQTPKGSLMMDCSATSIHRALQEGLDWENLDAIWISHFHLDHMGGLAPFLFGTKYAPEMQERKKPLRIFGASGLKNVLEVYDSAYDFGFLEQPFPLEVIEMEPLVKFPILDDLEAVSFDTPHTDESRAIQLRDGNGKALVFSADTGFSEALGSFAMGVDLFVLECSFFENKPVESHLKFDEAIYLAKYSKAKKVVLTHLYPEWDYVNFADEVKKLSLDFPVVESVDGLFIEL